MDIYVSDYLPLLLGALGVLLVWRLHRNSLAGPSRGWRRIYLCLRIGVLLLLCAMGGTQHQ